MYKDGIDLSLSAEEAATISKSESAKAKKDAEDAAKIEKAKAKADAKTDAEAARTAAKAAKDAKDLAVKDAQAVKALVAMSKTSR